MLKDTAHTFKEKYAKNHSTHLSFTHFAIVSFFKYVAPSLLLFLVVTMTIYSLDVCAEPQGFSNETEQRAAPKGFGLEANIRNTIKGVMENAHADDYVVLEGKFIKAIDAKLTKFKFTDAAGDVIELNFKEPAEIVYDQPYYIWGQISTSFLGFKSINVLLFNQIN